MFFLVVRTYTRVVVGGKDLIRAKALEAVLVKSMRILSISTSAFLFHQRLKTDKVSF